jgi:hypothetical protein
MHSTKGKLVPVLNELNTVSRRCSGHRGGNGVWVMIRESIKISAKESLGYFALKKHKTWFDEGCSKLLDQRKRAKLQWLQDPG